MTRRAQGSLERYPESLVEINPMDAERYGIENGKKVKVTTRRGSVEAKAQLTKRSPEGTIFMNFHFREVPTNILTNPALDPVAKPSSAL